jgi:tetratricopeptide (TPR) repeat protein
MILALALVLAIQDPQPLAGPTRIAAAEQLAQAEARYRAAIALTPGIAAYHESLAMVLEREGRYEDALGEHRQAVRLDSLASRNRAGLGVLLLRMGRSAEAVPELQAARAMDRSAIEVRKQLATALMQQSRSADALAVLREARQLDSTDRDVERAMAQAEGGKDTPSSASTSRVDTQQLMGGLRHAVQLLFAVVLGASALALVAPLLGGLMLALVHLPRELLRRSPT